MRSDAKILFHSLLKPLQCDLVLDVGSCDGSESLGFRNLDPQLPIVAFEANPLNYARMVASPVLKRGGIQVEPMAVSDRDGQARFHMRPGDYSQEHSTENNIGISSLLPSPKATETVTVATVRLDGYLDRDPFHRRIAIWMDVEGAEYAAVEGLRGVAGRVCLLHVESALVPKWPGQRPFRDLEALLESFGLVRLGSGIGAQENWGDVVFVSQQLLIEKGPLIRRALWKARLMFFFKPHHVARWMRGRCPGFYQKIRAWYGRHV